MRLHDETMQGQEVLLLTTQQIDPDTQFPSREIPTSLSSYQFQMATDLKVFQDI